jgi:SAM-dependent methyltransferase
MRDARGPWGNAFAHQVLSTTRAFREKSDGELDVLDLGCGYGDTAFHLAQTCRSVVGTEPAGELIRVAEDKRLKSPLPNLTFRKEGVEQLNERERYDLILLDNVYEHLPDHDRALTAITRALRPGGVLYLLTPNKLWPVEAHYRLPFLSYLPLPWANRYLRLTGRGIDYRDASYAPTYWSLKRRLDARPELSWRYVLPGERGITVSGTPLHYRLGMAAIERLPGLWAISKALLVVAVKERR